MLFVMNNVAINHTKIKRRCFIKTIDLVGPYSEVTKADIFTKRFGRLKDRSFYYIYEKNLNKENELYKEFIFMKNKDEFPI